MEADSQKLRLCQNFCSESYFCVRYWRATLIKPVILRAFKLETTYEAAADRLSVKGFIAS